MTALEGLLGLDPSSPDLLRAEQLADNDRALLRSLVGIRKARGLSQAAVGDIMGISQPSVAAFEAYDSNPTLGKIRRYAHAVRALIVHRVEPDEGQLLDRKQRHAWIGSSINNVPVQARTEGGPPSESITLVRSSGAASFPPSLDGRGIDFAVAA